MKGTQIVSVTLGTVAIATTFLVVTVEGQSRVKDHRIESFVPKRGAAPEGPRAWLNGQAPIGRLKLVLTI